MAEALEPGALPGVPVVPVEEGLDWAQAVTAYWQSMAEVTAAWCSETATWDEHSAESLSLLTQAIGQFQSLALSAAMTLQALKDEHGRLTAEREAADGG